jgi:hypothetical protein
MLFQGPRAGNMRFHCASFSTRNGVGPRQPQCWRIKLFLCRTQATAKSQNQVSGSFNDKRASEQGVVRILKIDGCARGE